jgi:PKD repeat protein
MFTAGQVTRMRTALTVNSTGRANVVSAANLAAVGATDAPALCAAKFSSPRRVICAGESLQFTDESFNAATGWNWSFAGGTPATSTTQNPTITYNTPGTYAVQLEATDGSTSNTANIAGYITVLPAPTGIPYYESFETFSNFTSPDWFVVNGGGNPWTVTTTAGKTGTHSAKLENFNQTPSQIDELESRSIDLSGITSATNVTLSFRYAYRKRTSTNNDVLKLFATKDCGEMWDLRRTFTAATMSGTTLETSAWTPAPADWITIHVTNITNTYWNENFRFKFQFIAGGGNNIYIDDINIYSGDPSEAIVLGINDLGSFQDINLYPNPADQEIQISFSSQTGNNPLKFAVTDLAGKIIRTIPVNAHEGANLVFIETSDLSAGTYLIKVTGSSEERTLTFVKK